MIGERDDLGMQSEKAFIKINPLPRTRNLYFLNYGRRNRKI